MKFTLHKLKIGDLVWAQVVELASADECIVSFQGDLIRVKNQSLTQLSTHDKVLVRVVTVRPLIFQLLNEKDKTQRATRINVSI